MNAVLTPEEAGALTRYDFRRPARMTSRARERVVACETQRAEHLTRGLTAAIGACELRLREAKEAMLQDACQAEIDPLFELPEFAPSGLVLCAFAAQLGQVWIERLLGGTGSPREIEREPTEIEIELLRLAAGSVAQALGFDAEHGVPEATYVDAAMRRNLEPQGGIVVVFECALGEKSAELRVFLTYDDYAAATGIGTVRHTDAGAKPRFDVEHMHGLAIELTARMPAQPISVADVANLRIGDILHLDRRVEDEIELRAGERPLFMGSPGCVGRSVGVRITKVL